MIIVIGKEKLEIDNKYATYSPFLRATMYSDGKAIINREKNVVMQCVKFLEGKPFMMTPAVEEAIAYLGFPNVFEYPSDFWYAKLRTNWIRDNMYRLKLWETDPYYGLQRVDVSGPLYTVVIGYEISDTIMQSTDIHVFSDRSIVPHRITPNRRREIEKHFTYLVMMLVSTGAAVVAGGAVLSIIKGTPIHDIDMFVLNTDLTLKILTDANEKYGDAIRVIGKSDSAITVEIYNLVMRRWDTVQIILRKYKCPSEIIHGFDVDCSGLLWNGFKFYGTETAKYAITMNKNWFDPERASPSYAYRLTKFHRRGIKVMLPMVEEVTVDIDIMTDLFVERAVRYVNKLVRADIVGTIRVNTQYVPVFDSIVAEEYTTVQNDVVTIAYKNPILKQIDVLSSPNIVSTDPQRLIRQIHILSDTFDSKASYYDLVLFGSDTYTDYKLLYFWNMITRSDVLFEIRKNILSTSSDTNATRQLLSQMKAAAMNISPQTQLLLANKFDITLFPRKISDYSGGVRTYGRFTLPDILPGIQWKTQNPMEQVSSTFYPEPIRENIIEWYGKSSLVV